MTHAGQHDRASPLSYPGRTHPRWRVAPRASQRVRVRWIIHEKIMGIDPDTRDAVVALDRCVGAAPLSHSELPFVDQICLQAIETHGDLGCAPKQTTAIISLDFGLVAHAMTEVECRLYSASSWETRGCTPWMVIECARSPGLVASILHNMRALETLPRPTPLVAALHEDHLCFYKRRARSVLLAWQCAPSDSAKRRREHAPSATTPPAGEWQLCIRVPPWALLRCGESHGSHTRLVPGGRALPARVVPTRGERPHGDRSPSRRVERAGCDHMHV